MNFEMVLTVATTVGTFAMAILMYKSNKLMAKSVDQVRELEIERSRPYVVFDFMIERNCVYATLKNIGVTPAYDVVTLVTPSLTSIDRNNLELGFVKNSISFLAPSRELKDFIAVGHRFFDDYKEARFEFSIKYKGKLGNIYTETGVLDINFQKTLITLSRPEPLKELEKISRSFSEITRHTQEIAQSMSQTTRDDN